MDEKFDVLQKKWREFAVDDIPRSASYLGSNRYKRTVCDHTHKHLLAKHIKHIKHTKMIDDANLQDTYKKEVELNRMYLKNLAE